MLLSLMLPFRFDYTSTNHLIMLFSPFILLAVMGIVAAATTTDNEQPGIAVDSSSEHGSKTSVATTVFFAHHHHNAVSGDGHNDISFNPLCAICRALCHGQTCKMCIPLCSPFGLVFDSDRAPPAFDRASLALHCPPLTLSPSRMRIHSSHISLFSPTPHIHLILPSYTSLGLHPQLTLPH